MSDELITTDQAAERLGVTPGRVRAMIAAGRLPAQKFGFVHMIKASDLKALEDRKVGRPPTKQPPKSSPSTEKRATGAARARNGTSTKKKGRKK